VNTATNYLEGTAVCDGCGVNPLDLYPKDKPVSARMLWADGWRGGAFGGSGYIVPGNENPTLYCPNCAAKKN
jgi:rubrerythrin